MDNFRGFRDTLVPLHDVNFLVGENSTGKTSFLRLMEAFSRMLFWATGLKEAKMFDTFDDFISAEGDQKRKFWIGFIEHDISPELSEAVVSRFQLMSYTDMDGIPDISEVLLYNGKELKSFTGLAEGAKLKSVYFSIESVGKLKWMDCQEKFKGYLRKFRNGNGSNSGLQPYSDILPKYEYLKEYFDKLPAALMIRIIELSEGHPKISESKNWYSAPIRSKPERTYDVAKKPVRYEEGEHTPYALRSMLTSGKAKEFRDSVQEFGKESGLFSKIDVKEIGEGRFELLVYLTDKAYNIVNVGYGVSQILPILIEMLTSEPNTWFGLQQPEVHLHPKAQAAFGELIFQVAQTRKLKFLIETHSEFIIDRFRLARKKSRARLLQSQVLYFSREGGKNRIDSIPIDSKGRYPDNKATKRFRNFFLDEVIATLEL